MLPGCASSGKIVNIKLVIDVHACQQQQVAYFHQMLTIYATAYNEALGMIETKTNSSEILNYLALSAEKASGTDAVVSILWIDEKGLLRNAASPRLPLDYLHAIDGLKPDPNVGTCAAAAATGKIVFTPSFYADNKWAELRHFPSALGFVGAWSYPIKSSDDKVLGTFGTYYRSQRHPSDEEMKGTELLASVAAMVLNKEFAFS